jgi:hypothetical protein
VRVAPPSSHSRARVAVAAHHQQVSADVGCHRQQRRADVVLGRAVRLEHRLDAVAAQPGLEPREAGRRLRFRTGAEHVEPSRPAQ